MFHVEQMIIPLAAAASLVYATEVAEVPEPYQGTIPPLQMALASTSVEAQQEMQAAMLDLLLGWQESARIHFKRVVELDSMCALGYCGLLMTEADPAAREQSRKTLTEKLDEMPATPMEAFYLTGFLKLAVNDQLGAAEDFIKRAEEYRMDTLSACWGILLLHCADLGYDEEGKPLRHQARALELASKLYAEHGDDPLVCFVRAYVEESAPVVSEEALKAAEAAAKQLSEHPIPSHLYGHLLYRSERAAEAVPHFMQAVRLATRSDIPEWESSVLMTSRLYVSTAMWASGQKNKALATRRALNRMPLDREHLDAPAVILQRWEAATLPLRILVATPEAPRLGLISAASEAAEVKPALEGDDPVLLVRDCLRACLHARLRAAYNDDVHAARSLGLAEAAYRAFEKSREDVLARGIHYITPWMRALEACQIAISMARAEVYTRTADMWRESARQAVRPVTLMLPPVIPQLEKAVAAAEEKAAKEAQEAAAKEEEEKAKEAEERKKAQQEAEKKAEKEQPKKEKPKSDEKKKSDKKKAEKPKKPVAKSTKKASGKKSTPKQQATKKPAPKAKPKSSAKPKSRKAPAPKVQPPAPQPQRRKSWIRRLFT